MSNKNNRPKRNKTKRNKIKNKRILSRRIKKKTRKRTKQRTKRYRNVNLIKQVGGRTQHIYGNWYLYTGTRGLATATYDYLYDKTVWRVQTPPVEERRGEGFIFINDISFELSFKAKNDSGYISIYVYGNWDRLLKLPREGRKKYSSDKLKNLPRFQDDNNSPPEIFGTTDFALEDQNIRERILFEIKKQIDGNDCSSNSETRCLLPEIDADMARCQKTQKLSNGIEGVAYIGDLFLTGDRIGREVVYKEINPRVSDNELLILSKIHESGNYSHIVNFVGFIRGNEDFGGIGNKIYVIEECIETSLNYFSSQRSEGQVFVFIESILDGIIFLQKIGIVHADIHGDNIMLCLEPSHGGNKWKLIDFGFSFFISQEEHKYLDFLKFRIYVIDKILGRSLTGKEKSFITQNCLGETLHARDSALRNRLYGDEESGRNTGGNLTYKNNYYLRVGLSSP